MKIINNEKEYNKLNGIIKVIENERKKKKKNKKKKKKKKKRKKRDADKMTK